jgi:hypothetical protein
MKFKALITTLILSTSSVALAKPIYVDNDPPLGDLSWRDHRGPMRPTWAPLSQMMRAGRRASVINVTENRDDLRAIRLNAGEGATYIYSLALRYDDGTRETITVNKWLYSAQPSLTFDLKQNREGLARVTVQTWTYGTSTFQLFGQQMLRTRPPVVQPLPPPPPPMPAPVASYLVGSNLTFTNTAGYVHVPVGVDKGRFTKMKIESLGSGTHISRVYVTFSTGTHQMFDLNKVFYRGESLELDLEGRQAHAITAITVMAGGDVRVINPTASKFNVSLL